MSGGGADDPYARIAYRRVIAWERRIEREGPLLRRLLADAPDRSVIDLGCGSGEHVAFFAAEGARAVGIDRSESMIEAARVHERAGLGRFLLGAVEGAPALLAEEPAFGLALCLGNVLPHVPDREALDAFLGAVHAVLRPEGVFLLQLLDYERILANGDRHLPLSFGDGDGGEEIVFLRLLRSTAGGRLLFFPTTLVLDPDADAPVRVEATKRIELTPWTRARLEPAFDAAGFDVDWRGDMAGRPYVEGASADLVGIARRRTAARGA